MFIHKYKVDDHEIFLVSKTSAKPSENMILTAKNWVGKSSESAVGNAVKFLKSLSFRKEEEAKREEKDEKARKTASAVARKFSAIIE